MFRNLLILLSASMFWFAGAALSVEPPMQKFIALGTASTSGVYFPVGRAVCDLVNKNRLTELVRCLAYPTGGSEYNIQAVISGELDVGITRSDLAYDAYHGLGDFAARGPSQTLRIISSLYDEPVVMIGRRDAGIRAFADIRGKRVNIGNRGSSQRNIVRMVRDGSNLTDTDFAATTEMTTDDMGQAFCKGEVDVIVQALGMPALFYKRMIEECGGVIIAIPPEIIDRIVGNRPSLMRLTIPGGLYTGHPDPIPSFGFRTALITSERIGDETIYRFTRSLTSQLAALKLSHPALQSLEPRAMAGEGVMIPLHSGAVRHYKELGLP